MESTGKPTAISTPDKKTLMEVANGRNEIYYIGCGQNDQC